MKKFTSLCAFAVYAMSAILLSSCSETQTIDQPTQSQGTSQGLDYRQSKAEVVVLNFFDMYCIHCQKDAKYVNELHSMVQARGMGSKINFYGIGKNNTPLESNTYKNRFHVPYPVIPDKNRSIAARFGKVRPPLIIALKKEGGQWKEFYRTHKTKGKANEIFLRIQP